jgi:hypothetical protein
MAKRRQSSAGHRPKRQKLSQRGDTGSYRAPSGAPAEDDEWEDEVEPLPRDQDYKITQSRKRTEEANLDDADEEVEAEGATEVEIDGQESGIVMDAAAILVALKDSTEDAYQPIVPQTASCDGSTGDPARVEGEPFDFFNRLGRRPELLIHLAKHVTPIALIRLCSLSKAVHLVVSNNMSHVMKGAAANQAPLASQIYAFNLYDTLCCDDPAGRQRPGSTATRRVPSLRWLRMVVHRQRVVRDILACMAREGHRMPRSMGLSLHKMWLLMDVATTRRRVRLLHNEVLFADQDLYNWAMFFVKLEMRFNDPTDGPGDDGLRRLMLGQRGLTPLRQLLKRERFLEVGEVAAASVRYSCSVEAQHRGLSILGVPAQEIGRGHLEGWGQGRVHLCRPDELLMREACRRRLELHEHVMPMLLWGYVDPVSKENIQVTAEEMYVSDEEDVALAAAGVGDGDDGPGMLGRVFGGEWREWETDDEGEDASASLERVM